MTSSAGWITTAAVAIGMGTIVLATTIATPTWAQTVLPQMRVTSDFDAPYAGLPPDEALPPPRFSGPRYDDRPGYDQPGYDRPAYAPTVLAPTEVYGILRRTGYSPLGIPQQRGLVYTIAVISPDGDDGRLIIDARTGRILRFMPAYRLGDRMNDAVTVSYGPPSLSPPVNDMRGAARPPLPRVASRTPGVPLPKAVPHAAVAARPTAQAAVITPAPASSPVTIEARPAAPAVQATQEIPAVQGLE